MDAPAFWFYPGDFIRDEHVLLMDLRQVGAYILLLSHNWIEGSIPADATTCARLLGRECVGDDPGPILAPVLERFPVGDDGRRRNPRLEEERARMRTRSAIRAAAGAAGAQSRWQTHGKRMANASVCHRFANGKPMACHLQTSKNARAREEQESDHLTAPRPKKSPPIEPPPDAIPMEEGARRAATLRDLIMEADRATGATGRDSGDGSDQDVGGGPKSSP